MCRRTHPQSRSVTGTCSLRRRRIRTREASEGEGFSCISAAYDLLSSETRRAEHDRELARQELPRTPEMLAAALALASPGASWQQQPCSFLYLEGRGSEASTFPQLPASRPRALQASYKFLRSMPVCAMPSARPPSSYPPCLQWPATGAHTAANEHHLAEPISCIGRPKKLPGGSSGTVASLMVLWGWDRRTIALVTGCAHFD